VSARVRFKPPIAPQDIPPYCDVPPTAQPSSSLQTEGWELG